jgi:hypothetical protein
VGRLRPPHRLPNREGPELLKLHAARKDLLAGGTFVVIGLAFAIAASNYELGTALRMGPGYFPLVLLGIGIAVSGFVAASGDDLGPVPWKAMALLVAALIFFGYTVRGLGIVPALLVSVFLTAIAAHRARLVPAVITAVSLTALSVLVFVILLQLRLPYFGPWLQG